MDYPRIWQAVTTSAWAILPVKLGDIIDVLTLRRAGVRLSDEEIHARLEAAGVVAAKPTQARSQGSIAVLPLYGTIAPRIGSMAEASGGTSTERFGQMFRAAMADPQIGAVVIDVDSPGGAVAGVPELADEIYASRGSKPIVAVANQMAASAAYWIASAADEFVASPSADVGSIGVYAAHQDVSGALAQEGIKTTLISAGKYKVEGNPYEPLSEEARAALQESVDEAYDLFVSHVARHRGVSPADVRNGYGQGRVLSAKRAKAVGMVDRVETLDATIERLRKRRPVSAGNGRAEAEPVTFVDYAAELTNTASASEITTENLTAIYNREEPKDTPAIDPAADLDLRNRRRRVYEVR